MEGIKITRVESIQGGEINFDDDSQDQHIDLTIIDSEDENDDMSFTFLENKNEGLIIQDVFRCVEVIDSDNKQIEYINLQNAEENDCYDWTKSEKFEEDPLALDTSYNSSNGINKEQENEDYKLTAGTSSNLCYDTLSHENQAAGNVCPKKVFGLPKPKVLVSDLVKKHHNKTSDPPTKILPNIRGGNRRVNKCSRCNEKFDSCAELLKHIDTHAVGKLYFYDSIEDIGLPDQIVYLKTPDSDEKLPMHLDISTEANGVLPSEYTNTIELD